MAARVRIEWVEIGRGSVHDAAPAISVRKFISAVAEFAVTETATAGSSRPSVPALLNDGYGICARISVLDNPVFVAWGADPTATSTAGIRIEQGQPELVAVNAGDLLSFVTAPVGDPIPNGTDATGVTQLAGGTGIRGWLSGIFSILGIATGAAVITDAAGTVQQYLRGIVKQWATWLALWGALADAAWDRGAGAATSVLALFRGIGTGIESIRVLLAGAGTFTTGSDVNVAAASTLVLAVNANRKNGSYIICNTTAISYFNLGAAASVGDAAVDGKTTVAGVFYLPDGFKGAVYAWGASATGTWRPVEALA